MPLFSSQIFTAAEIKRLVLWLDVVLHENVSTDLLCHEPVGGGVELSRWAPCTFLSIDSRRLHSLNEKPQDQDVRLLLLEI